MNLNKKIRKQALIFSIIIILMFSSTPISAIFFYKGRNEINEEANTIRTSSGNTWTVDDDGSGDFITIKDALVYANPGDTIIVYPGLYIEDNIITIDKPLTIKSRDGPEVTIIQPIRESENIFEITGSNITIDGFYIKGSRGIDVIKYPWTPVSPSHIYLLNNKILNTGISIFGANNVDVMNNEINGAYAGILVSVSSYNCRILTNTIRKSIHGIWLDGSNNNIVRYNTVEESDIGILLLGNENQVSDNTVINNDYHGILLLHDDCENIISSNTVNNNGGWGIFMTGCDDNTIMGNTVNYNTQGGIIIQSYDETPDHASDHNLVSNNIVNYNGGTGICLKGTRFRCTYNTISKNTVNYNSLDGIKLHNSDHNEISENKVHYSPTGITLVSSNYNVISFNNLLNNDLCISESSDCIGNIFENNNCPTPNQPPVAVFTYSPDKPIIGEKIKFNASNSYDPEGGELNYVWNFGDGNIKLGKIVENIYYEEGEHDVNLTVQDNIGQMTTIHKTITIVTHWSYAIITDLHIGRGYENYQGENYYLTERLNLTIQEIIENKDSNNIKFVMVLGDLSENGKIKELEKAKDILDILNDPDGNGNTDDGLPYFPVIGNHEVNSDEWDDERKNFNDLFSLAFFTRQFELLGIDWDSVSDWDHSKYVNYAFIIGNMKFICLDFVQEGLLNVWGKKHTQTLDSLSNYLAGGYNAILFSHIPLVPIIGFLEDLGEFSQMNGWQNVESCFAGHAHGFYDSDPKSPRLDWQPVKIGNPIIEIQDWIFGNPIFFNANHEYGFHITPGNIPVMTTEALMVGSNEGEPKGIIRIVDIISTIIQGEIVDYNKLIGEFSSINPYLDITDFVYPYGNYYQVQFDIFPFTGGTLWGLISGFLFLDRRFEILSYHLDFGDGESDFNLDWKPLMPTTINHSYYLDPQIGSKTYNVELKMIGITIEGEIVTETIEKKLYLQHKEPEFYIMSNSPVDLIVVDPDDLQISKDVNEIDRALYDEFDIDGDGELEDLILFLERKEGEYLITVVPEQDALPTDIYTLEASANSIITILANDVQIQNIPEKLYIIESTEEKIESIIPATIDFDPDTLNLNSPSKWVTVYIEVPIGHGYDISEINIESVMLNDEILAEFKPTEISDYDEDGIPDLMVKFSRKAIQELLQIGENVIITITGELIDGRRFKGMDTIRVISQVEYSESSNFLLIISDVLDLPSFIFAITFLSFIGIAVYTSKKLEEI